MANNEKIISKSVFEEAIKDILTELVNSTYEWEEYTPEQISNILEITDEQAMQLTKILNDQVVANNKLWSSSKTDAEIKNALIESNKYADELIGKISSISLEYVTTLPTSDIKSNVIYILQGTPNTLNVFNESTSSFVSVGDLNLDLSGYYTSTQVDNLLADKADDNTVVHADDIVADLTTTSGSTTLSTAGLQTELDKKIDKSAILSAVSATPNDNNVLSEKATKTELDKKIDKTSILTSYSDTATDDQVYSAKALNTELDKKANDDEVLKTTDIVTTIDKTSTDDKVPSASAIYNKSKNKITDLPNGTDIIAYADSISNETVADTVRIMNSPNSPYGAAGSDFYYTIYNITDDGYKRIVAYDIRKNDMYMIMKHSGTWGTWRKVCVTRVEDVPKTRIDLPNISPEFATGYIEFEVYNGVCYMGIFNLAFVNTPTDNLVVNIPGIPKRKNDGWHTITNVTSLKPLVLNIGLNGGSIEFYAVREVGTSYYGTFSYPVAES